MIIKKIPIGQLDFLLEVDAFSWFISTTTLTSDDINSNTKVTTAYFDNIRASKIELILATSCQRIKDSIAVAIDWYLNTYAHPTQACSGVIKIINSQDILYDPTTPVLKVLIPYLIANENVYHQLTGLIGHLPLETSGKILQIIDLINELKIDYLCSFDIDEQLLQGDLKCQEEIFKEESYLKDESVWLSGAPLFSLLGKHSAEYDFDEKSQKRACNN